MKFETLQTNLKNVTHVIHIADVHIRNFKRHKEYLQVFSNLNKKISDIIKKHPGTIIVVAGDIVHSKTDMSPELVNVTHDFLSELSKLAYTIVIPGNHDCNMNNPDRLDALSPIIKGINESGNSKLIYLKDSGLFYFADITFVHNSILDGEFIRQSDVSDKLKGKSIALYHGPLSNSETDVGYNVQGRFSVGDFKGYDFGMFGDIHRHQFLDKKKTKAYCGSLLGQDYGELNTGHGFILWDLSKNSGKHHEVKNDWGYYTIRITNDVVENLPSEFCKFPRIKIMSTNSNSHAVNKLIEDIRSTTQIEDLRVQKSSVDSTRDNKNKLHTLFSNIRDVSTQNRMITDYLKSKYDITEDIENQIVDINIDINKYLDVDAVVRNIEWKPVLFKWSNMFSYGENNELEFDNKVGLYGLIASNASGKSNLIDALLVCLFDKCTRAFKASNILNNKRETFYCELEFKIGDQSFWIRRNGKKDKKGHVKVDVDFWTEVDGSKESLNGIDRDDTNKIIRSYIGEYDDFILTTVSSQAANTNFIDLGQKERKELLSQFLDTSLFESLYVRANDLLKETQVLIRDYSRKDYPMEIAKIVDTIKELTVEITTADDEILTFEESIADTQTLMNNSLRSLNKVPDDAKYVDINELDQCITSSQDEIDSIKIKIDECIANKSEHNKYIKTFQKKYPVGVIDELLKIETDITSYTTDIATIENELRVHAVRVKELQKKIDHLSDHVYDPNCKFCVQNIFVVDAKKAEEDLKQLMPIVNTLNETRKNKKRELELLKSREHEIDEYRTGKITLDNKTLELSRIDTSIERNKNSISKLENTMSECNKQKELQLLWENQLLENRKINETIHEYENTISECKSVLELLNTKKLKFSSEVASLNFKLNEIREKQEVLKELETQYKSYEYYLMAVNRNGLPYDLIAQALPQIESEVNSILNQMVEFSIVFDTDGKSINCFIAYDDDNFWTVELTSGMERFVTSIAIRIALLSVSSLPRPNFLIIDEGMGVFDSENLNSFPVILDYMKSQFDIVFMVTHIDVVKDYFDKRIYITKENGFSYIKS